MLAELSPDTSLVVLRTTNLKESGKLSKFPGLAKQGYDYVLPAKLNVLHNLFSRLRTYIPGSVVSPEVKAFRATKEVIRDLPAEFYYHTEPLKHQDLGLRLLWTRGNLGLLADPGLGKTKMVLDYLFLLKQQKIEGKFKGLVICPKALLFVWLMEAAKHRPELSIHVIEGVNYKQKIADRMEKLPNKDVEAEIRKLKRDRDKENAGIAAADVIVVNYAKLVFGQQFFIANQWDAMAIDEGLVKNPYSQQTEVITKLSKKVPSRVIMSGTLINNGPQDVFSPVRILEPTLLGTSFSKFNKYYGVEVKSKDRSFVVGYRNIEEIKSCLHACSAVFRKEEWLDLPEKTFEVIKVPLPETTQKFMEDLQSNLTMQLPTGEWISADNHLSLYCKLNQMSNGFLYINEDARDDEEVLEDIGIAYLYERSRKMRKKKPPKRLGTYFLEDQPKVLALRTLLQTRLSKLRFVLWYNMSGELDLILKELESQGIQPLVVKGGTTDTGRIINLFNADPSYQVLVCQAKAVNYGVTILGTSLDDCDYEPELSSEVFTHVFYSLNNSLEVFIQQQDRSHRIGLIQSPTYYILQTDYFVENSIYDRLLSRQEIREDFLLDITKRGIYNRGSNLNSSNG